MTNTTEALDYLKYSTLPLTTEEATVANALDVLRAYPGKDASDVKLAVWEAMRESILTDEGYNGTR